jgi:hypothetical protein
METSPRKPVNLLAVQCGVPKALDHKAKNFSNYAHIKLEPLTPTVGGFVNQYPKDLLVQN